MTHFAVFCPPYEGHLNPMLALAGALVARGHAATFVGQPDMAARVRGPRIAFAPVGVGSHPLGTGERMAARLGATTGLFGIGAVIRDVARTTDMLCRDAPEVLRAVGATALLCDQTEAAGGLVARHLALPFASVANALLVNREPGVPPPFVDWPYAETDGAVRRNVGGYRVADWLMTPVRRVVRRHAARWSLGPLGAVEDCLSPTLQISQTVRGLDWPRREPPPSLAHVGPLRGPEIGAWDDQGGPLVFCSLGTLQGGRLPIFRAVAEACARLDLRLLVAHGGKLSERQTATLPGRVRAERFVPQRAVLRHTTVAVTHGGLNTTLDALAAGVPLLVVPLAFEQGAIAARVARCGAGLVIGPRRLTVARLERALARLLTDESFRRSAATLRDEIAASGGVARAADLVERAVALGAR